ncbi:MAG: hydantoinase B/oxoprolinase family protein, partial [Hyphomicrobiaceae bacterium]|nr:hydantoinase B/oxoprolinase family protein [Hyphomicrobiaceae bacterium]
SPEALAADFFAIAVENMANAIRKISVARGYDVSTYTLCCFGAAGGQAACAVAAALGMRTVLIHPLSGLLSAHGIGLARLRAVERRSVERPFDAASLADTRATATNLERELSAALVAQGANARDIVCEARLALRYETSEATVPVPLTLSSVEIIERFEREHVTQFGFLSRDKRVHIASLEVEASDGDVSEDVQFNTTITRSIAAAATAPIPTTKTRIFHGSNWHPAAIYHRAALSPGATIAGPAIVIEPHQTIVVDPGWTLAVTPRDDIVLTHTGTEKATATHLDDCDLNTADPALVELYNNRFMGIAEDMGEALRRTAQSVNIKERLDFSCAVFDASGQLIANAPHVPVHLGSMDASVATVVHSRAASLRPGDSVMLNAPYNGGTHLPDITVVTPVFDQAGQSILFWLASRGHHEDIGGISPGSMSPLATHIDEEGVLIDDVMLVAGGRFLETETRALLTGARHPARRPDQNIADLKAQVAANARGATALQALVAAHGLAQVRAYMRHVLDAGEAAVRRLIARQAEHWRGGAIRVETDSGAVIAVRVTADGTNQTATIDFTGTSPQQPSNANAPEAVTRAAVLYCFRVLTGEAIPLNAGCLRPLTIIVPEGSMLSPRHPAAVVAGNTETSQAVTNAVFGALEALGSAQGTMNNLTFGNDRLQYYETICSGAPAGPGFDGAAGVHVHMTNTRMTDPEILELRYPVIVERFAVSRGSGGRGRWHSGDGVVRSLRFLECMRGAILSGGRRIAPFGVVGGEPGRRGRNTITRANGQVEDLGGSAAFVVSPGDTITITTPTGGGFGPPG